MTRSSTLMVFAGAFNAAISIYSDFTSSYQLPDIGMTFIFVIITALAPMGIALAGTYGRKRPSFLKDVCAILTVLSGVYFLRLYIFETDPSRIMLLGIHSALTYALSFISLLAPKESGSE